MERVTVVNIARSFIDTEKYSKKHKKIIDAFNRVKPDGYTAKLSDPYCAEFFSAVFILAYGKKNAMKMVPMSASCPRLQSKAKQMGLWIEIDSYHTKLGDGILYDWDDTGKGDNHGSPDHVGIIVDITKTGFTVCEGNMGSAHKVGYRHLKYNNKFIRGFITPKFSKKKKLDDETLNRLVNDVLAGKYGNGAERKEKLGEYYEEVQNEVNRRLKHGI